MTSVELSALTPDDLPQALELEARTYGTPWSARIFEEELAAPGRLYLKASAGETLVGYGGLMLVLPEAHITTVVVDALHRGSRIGSRLLLELTEEAIRRGAASLTLEVRMSNEAAQALYRRFGMAPVGVRKQYYVDEDALIMWVHDIRSEEYAERLAGIREDLT